MNSLLDYVRRHSDAIAVCIVALTALTTLLLFNVRMNEGGDDSGYICRALDFLQDGRYPNFQGPLYPLFLSIFVWISGGVKVVGLKLTSTILLVFSQALFYYSLRRQVSRPLLLSVMLLMALNPWFLEFGSLTYSEAMFTLLEWAVVWAVLKADVATERRQLLVWAAVAGLLVVVSFLVRTIGFGLGIAALVYLLVRRRPLAAVSLVGGVLVSFGLWVAIRTAVWGDVSTRGQLDTLLQVDPYDPSDGLETPAGYVGRLTGNAELYLSKHIVKMLGFRDKDSREKGKPLTVFLVLLFGWSLWCVYRRGGALMLVGITVTIMFGTTFLSLQVIWDQYRLIVPYVSMAYLVVLYGVYRLFRLISPSNSIVSMSIVVLVLTILCLRQVGAKSDFLTLRKNLRGDHLYGYTPDFYNYLSLCEKVGKDMPDSYVACRKPELARIYSGGKKFYGIYNIPSNDPDVLVEQLRSRGVTHVIVASLRRDPMSATAGVINTVHRYLKCILDKYPTFLANEQQEGETNHEPAYIFRINYPVQVNN